MRIGNACVASTWTTVILFHAALSPAATPPDQAARVLIVRNTNSPISKAIADDYSARRGVTNVLNIACQDAAVKTDSETITFKKYLSAIDAPLRGYLAAHPGIDFIVMTKGVPIRLLGPDMDNGYGGTWVKADSSAQNHSGSLDSYVAALGYDTIKGAIRILTISDNKAYQGFKGASWANRYFNSTKHFTHAEFGGYLVTRLDGYTVAEAIGLTTKSLLADSLRLAKKIPTGKILQDEFVGAGFTSEATQPYSIVKADPPKNDTSTEVEESTWGDYNADMALAHDSLKARKIPDSLNKTPGVFVGHMTNLMGYCSWGCNDGDVNWGDSTVSLVLYHSLGFMAGAICETAVSTGARTFLPTSGGQTLIVDLIHQGCTGVKGYTDEPWLQAGAQPSIMFLRYTAGWNLAESYYAASNEVAWEDIVIGDPLCIAYPSDSLLTTGVQSFPKLNPAAPISVSQDSRRVVFTVGGNLEISRVTLVITSAQGKIVQKLINNNGTRSSKTIVWNLSGNSHRRVQPGAYAYQLSQDNGRTTRCFEGTVTVTR